MYGIFALYKKSHPNIMTSNHLFYHITPTIIDIVSTVSVSSHPLFSWYHTNCIYEVSSTIYHEILSIVYHMTASGSVSSHPLFRWYHTLCMYDMTPTICITSYILYKASHPHFMTSYHIIDYITFTAFMTSLPLYLTLQPLYLCHKNHSIDKLRMTVCMTSHPLYVWHHMNSMWHHTHSLWYKKTLLMTSYPLYSWHHTHCICVITPTCLMISHPMYVWSHTRCMYDTIGSVSDITSTLDDIKPMFVCHVIHYVYDIIFTIYHVTHTVSMTRQALYLSWNPFCLPP